MGFWKYRIGLAAGSVCAIVVAMLAPAVVVAAEPAPVSPITFALSVKADADAVMSGGVQRAGRFLALGDLISDADLQKLWGWSDTAVHVDVLAIKGGAPNAVAGVLQGMDNIEAVNGVKLYQAWVEKAFPHLRTTVRAGLYDLNSEFYVTDSAALLIAPAFGIGSTLGATGPNGPSIYPSTSPAIRVRVQPTADSYAQLAVLGAQAGDPGDRGGVDTAMAEGGLMIAEAGLTAHGKTALGVWR
jgi:porin